jgi:hypothetical protein
MFFGEVIKSFFTFIQITFHRHIDICIILGECWIVVCTDVDDKDTGKNLLESSVASLKGSDSCRGGALQCHSKLPSGKTIIQRLKLSIPPKGHPLLFIAANGDQPRALALKEFAKIKDSKKGAGSAGTATPDAKILTASIQKASLPVKPVTVTTNEGFKTKCLNQRHCILLITNSSASKEAGFKGSGDRATLGLAEVLFGSLSADIYIYGLYMLYIYESNSIYICAKILILCFVVLL